MPKPALAIDLSPAPELEISPNDWSLPADLSLTSDFEITVVLSTPPELDLLPPSRRAR